jgi:hypothetical protein
MTMMTMTICAECLTLSMFLFCLLFGVAYCLLMLDDDGDVQPDPTPYAADSGWGVGPIDPNAATVVLPPQSVGCLDDETRPANADTVVLVYGSLWDDESESTDDAPLGLCDDDPEYLDIPGGCYFE